MRSDDLIDTLIKPPRVLHEGFDWTRTDKLKPNGDHAKEATVAARLSPKEHRDDQV